MTEKPVPEKGIKRIFKAFLYSLSGFRMAFRDEAAFRQELALVMILSPVCLLLAIPVWTKSLILFSHVLILIVELLNTAVESSVDLASSDFHEEAKKAKDTASSAVLLSLLLSAGLWIYAMSWLIYS